MMKYTAILAGLIISFSVFAQQRPGFDFLKVDPSARSSALGGAFETYTDDPNVMFYNPAGLSTLTSGKVSASFGKHLLDINFGTASYGMKYKDIGWFGAAVKYFNYGKFERTDENAVSTGGKFSANDVMLSLSYSNLVYEKINFGLTAKYIYSNIAEYNSNAIALDVGFLYLMPDKNMAIAFSINNIGKAFDGYIGSKERLPLDIRVGMSGKLEHLPLRLSGSISNINEDKAGIVKRLKNFSIGGEFMFSDNVNLRIGYSNEKRQDLKLGTSIGIAGFSAGIGIKIADKYQFDYSLNSLGNIGSTHRFTLGYSFKSDSKTVQK